MNVERAAHLIERAKSYLSDMLNFLSDLIRIPSVNGQDTERSVALRVIQEAKKIGLLSELIHKEIERPNVLAKIGSGKDGFALIAHMDTVSPGNLQNWSSPPFEAHIQNGILFGRGAADNKAGLACGLYTLALMRDLSLLDFDTQMVLLAGVADEESGACSLLGVRYLLDNHFLPVRGAIYTYASDVICIGHRGLIRIEITALGKSVHAGIEEWHQKTSGVNAVTGLAEVILKLENLDIPTQKVNGFEHLGCTITPGTLIQGGDFPSVVPDKASAMVDIRLMPGQHVTGVMKEIDRVISEVKASRPGLMIEINKKVQIPGVAIPVDHPLAVIAQEYTRLFTGRAWEIKGAGPGNEGYMLISAGIPTLCGFGPKGGNPHAPDEWVEIESLTTTIAMYAAIIGQYLGDH